nr:hypothetical protein [Tanacetum cinerariifolium]
PGAQAEGQTGSDAGTQDEGQARSNPDKISEGQAGPDPEKLDKGFTATAYPKVQENLKLTVEEQVLLEDPASSSGTLSSLQHLSKDISFRDLFFSDKPSEANNDKTTVETEVESMVSVTIQQDMSSIPPMTSPIIELTSRPESSKRGVTTTAYPRVQENLKLAVEEQVHQQFKATTTDTPTTTTTTTLPPPQAQQQITVEAMMIQRIGELEHIMANLIQVNKDMEERLDKHGARLHTLEQLDIPHQVSKAGSEVVTDAELAQDLAEARKKKKKSRESPKMPPGSPPHHPPPPPPPPGPSPGASESAQVPPPSPPPSSTNQESPSKGSTTPSSSKTAASAEYQAWTTTDIRLRQSISLTPADLEIDADMVPNEQAQSSDDEDIGSAHIPMVNLRQDRWKPFEEERHATPKPAWSIRSSDVPVPTNNWASVLASNYSPPPKDSLLVQTGPAYEIVKVFHSNVIHLQYQMEECHKLLTDSVDDPILRHNVSKPLPLGGPPGQVTIQSDFFFNKDLEYLRYGSKGRKPALSISKMKTTYYPDAGLEQMVPDQFWINECKYDIAAMYGISHRWFQRQRFYIDRHTSEGDRIAFRTHMRILSVVRIEVFSISVPAKPSRSLEPPPTERQEDSYYGRQPLDQTAGYQTTRRRLPA